MHLSNDRIETVQHELAKSRELSKPFYCACYSYGSINWLLQSVFVRGRLYKDKATWSVMEYPSCVSYASVTVLNADYMIELLVNPFRNLLL